METIDLEKIEKAAGIDKKVVEVYRMLKRFKDDPKRIQWLKERKENWQAVAENKHWSEKEEKEMAKAGQVPLVINKLNKGVQGASAIVTDNKPEWKVLPIGSGDLYVAELMKRALDFVWGKNDGTDVIYDGVEESKISGMGVWEVTHNRNKGGVYGRCEFEEIDPADIYFDSLSRKRDFSDTEVIKAKLRTKKYIKENYRDLKDEDLEFTDGISEDPVESVRVTGADNYTKGPDQAGSSNQNRPEVWEINAYLLDTKVKQWVLVVENGELVRVEPPEGVSAKDHAAELGNGAKVWEERREIRVQRLIVGKKLIEENEDPYGQDADGDPILPIIPLKHDRTTSAYPTCPTTKARPINKEKNKRRAQFIHAASHEINSPIVRTDGCRWSGEPGTAGSELIVDTKGVAMPPYRLQTGAAALTGFLNLEQQADRDIDEQYDLQDVMRGKLPDGQKVAWQSVYALQDGAGTMTKPFMRKLEGAMCRLAKVVLADILKHWPRQQWERLLEPEEVLTLQEKSGQLFRVSPEMMENPQDEMGQNESKWKDALDRIRPSDYSAEPAIKMVDLDVKIVAGSSLPTNRMAKSQYAMEMAKAGVYDRKAVLEYVDDPRKDEIAERMDQQEAAMAEAAMKKGK